MPKTEAEWRKLVEDWKKILNEPKNLGLKAGGTGISERIRFVADAELEIATAKGGGNISLTAAYADLASALNQLIDLCGKTGDKHKKLFTTACAWLDEHVKKPANTRKGEIQGEVAALRQAMIHKCAGAFQSLQDAAHDAEAFKAAWAEYVKELKSHQLAFPHLKQFVAKAETQKAGDVAAYLKLARECQNATTAVA